MKVSFQETDNTKTISEFEKITGRDFVNDEAFKGKRDGHKFRVGQRCKLFGLEDYPEFNGEIVEITSVREDGPHGKAYYFKGKNPMIAKQLNWTYEYRLEKYNHRIHSGRQGRRSFKLQSHYSLPAGGA